MTTEPQRQRCFTAGTVALRASEELAAEVIAERTPITSCSPCWSFPRSKLLA